jgi:hypothetical protein
MKLKSILQFLTGAALVTALLAPATRAAVSIGAAAPDFTLTDLNGQTYHLSDYRGKTVVLEWNNPDCPFVKKHYESGNIPGLQKSAMADGVVWLLINSGAPGQDGVYPPAELQAWLTKEGSSPTAYLLDASGTVGRLYSAKTTPHMFVITADGTLVYDGAIDSIRSAKISDIAKATNYVTVALDAVKAGKPVKPSVTQPYGCSVKY